MSDISDIGDMKTATHPDLLSQIKAFCDARDMTPTEFGRRSINDQNLVFDLEKGRDIRLSTQRRIVDFMASSEAAE